MRIFDQSGHLGHPNRDSPRGFSYFGMLPNGGPGSMILRHRLHMGIGEIIVLVPMPERAKWGNFSRVIEHDRSLKGIRPSRACRPLPAPPPQRQRLIRPRSRVLIVRLPRIETHCGLDESRAQKDAFTRRNGCDVLPPNGVVPGNRHQIQALVGNRSQTPRKGAGQEVVGIRRCMRHKGSIRVRKRDL